MSFGLIQSLNNNLADLRQRFGPDVALPRFRPDREMTEGTVGIWDFSIPWCAPGGDVAVQPSNGVTARNLVRAGQPATFDNANVTYAGNALVFPRYQGNIDNAFARAALGTVKLQAGLLANIWVKSKRLGIAGGNNRLLLINGLLDIFLTGDDNGRCTIFEVIAPGASGGNGLSVIDNQDLREALSDDRLHLISLLVEDVGGGKYRMVVYLDSMVVHVGAVLPLGSLPAQGAVVFGAGTALYTIEGKGPRVRLDDVAKARRTADEITRGEYLGHAARLRALV